MHIYTELAGTGYSVVICIKRKMKNGGMNGFWSYMGQQQNPSDESYGAQQKKQEGKVIISDIPRQEKVIDKEVGEYVDFEE